MAASPPLKVFNPQGEYIASCKMYEDAANLAGSYGAGAKIKHGTVLIWTEGAEEFSAAESFDGAASIMATRWSEHQRKAYEKTHGYVRSAVS